MNNDFQICTIESYNGDYIKVNKPYYVNDSTCIFNVKYNNSIFLIQTSVCIIPYSYALFDNNAFKLDVITDNEDLYNMLSSISECIVSKINRHNLNHLLGKDIKQLCVKINSNNTFSRYKLSLRNKDANNIYVFNSQQQPISLTTLHTFDKVVCLFELKRLVIKDNTVFWQTNLIQIKKCSSIIQPSFADCLIVDTNIQSLQDRFTAYNKMLKLKIPLNAIKHKMKMDGLTENDFIQWYNEVTAGKDNDKKIDIKECLSTETKSPAPPPPPPPLPLFNSKQMLSTTDKCCNMPQFLQDITSGNFKLRKSTSEKIKNKILSNVNTSYKPPSLDDIQNALSRLKRVT